MFKRNGFTAVAAALTLILAGCGGGSGGGGETAPGDSSALEDDGSQQQEPGGREALEVLTSTVMEKVTIDTKVYRPDVAISDQGEALAVWAEEVNGKIRLAAVEGDAEEGTWGSKTFLDDGKGIYVPGSAWLSTQVTMDASGNGMIGWIQSVEDSDKTHLKTIAYSTESGFDSPVDHGPTRSFILKGNDAGDVLIMWEMEFALNKYDITSAFRPSGASSWETKQNLTGGEETGEYTSPNSLYLSRIAMNESGEATLLYKGTGPAVESNSRKLQALYRDANGEWSFPETLVEGAAITNVGPFATAIDKAGNRFSGWVHRNSDDILLLGVMTTAEMAGSQNIEYFASIESAARLAATYRKDGSLVVAAEQEMTSQGLRPLMTLEIIGEEVNQKVYGTGGRYLSLESAGNRVVSLGRNRCSTGMGVRESIEQGQLMSEPLCSTGNAQENVELAVTPDRAGVFAGIGTVLDESTFPATRQNVVELTFFR